MRPQNPTARCWATLGRPFVGDSSVIRANPRTGLLSFLKAYSMAQADPRRTTRPTVSVTWGESKLILQGAQHGPGWSMTIARETGAMALTATGDRMAFVIFGACTPL